MSVSLIFLGGVTNQSGKDIIEKCKAYALKNSNLQFFETNIIDQPQFDRIMEEAHIALLPTVIRTVLLDGITEIYGVSTSSGNISDVIKYAKPFIIPTKLQIPLNMQSSSFTYSTQKDIIDFLESLLLNPDKYIALKEKAVHNSKEYTLEKIRNKNPSLFGINV